MLNFTLTDEQNQLKSKAREFALKHVLPVAAYYDEQDETPVAVLKKAFEQGLINNEIPKKYGGSGFGIIEGVIVTEEIAAACPGIATSIFDNALGMEPLILCDNDAAKKKYLKTIAGEFKLISFATSEPMMGSDVSGIRCTAAKDGDDFILNGTKYWVTNGGIADYFTIFATEDPKSAHKGICAFLVEKAWEGITIGKAIPKLGHRCLCSGGGKVRNGARPVLCQKTPGLWRAGFQLPVHPVQACGNVSKGGNRPAACMEGRLGR